MSLLEEWVQRGDPGASDFDESGSLAMGQGTGDSLMDSMSTGQSGAVQEHKIFSLEMTERSIARGRGQVSSLAVASGLVVLVTTRGWLLAYDFADSTSPVVEWELSKDPNAEAHSVWIDPNGVHCLAVVKISSSFETHYWHRKWKKTRLLAKLKGIHITALAFNALQCTETNTGEIALGTADGKVLSLVCDEKDKKEKLGQGWAISEDHKEAIIGIQQVPLKHERVLLLISTQTRMYVFTGPSALETLGQGYKGAHGLGNCVELPSDFPSGCLACYTPASSGISQRFAWLSGPGLYKGAINAQTHAKLPELDYLTDHNLLPLPVVDGFMEAPLAVAQTEFHELVLYKSRVHMINRVSQTLSQELIFLGRGSSGQLTGYPISFAQDIVEDILYIYTGDALYEVGVSEEDKMMWRVYLDRNEFAQAIRYCRNQTQRDAVYHAQAEAAFNDGNLREAAQLWGKVTSSPPAFEEIALKFVEVSAPEALHLFLQAKLDSLSSSDKAQATMVATWLLELILDHINRALLEDGVRDKSEPSKSEELSTQLQNFLGKNVDILDARTATVLLASYGRIDNLVHLASCRQDHEAVLEYLVQRGDSKRALAILRRPDVSQELFYKFAPTLMAVSPTETMDACLAARPELQPSRLLPALLRYTEASQQPACQAQALRYVDFCLHTLHSEDPAVHQLAVGLYCGQEDEKQLLDYLRTARDKLGLPLYNPQAALRLARHSKRMRASVELLWELGLHQDAVAAALEFDKEVAIALANRIEDTVIGRKLWLAIACHLIQDVQDRSSINPGEGISMMNKLMKQADGLIKIEDVLPLFPDFVQIDEFKDAICQSLADYNEQIAELKSKMDDATRIADALRKDAARVEHRTATLDEFELCASCNRPMRDSGPADARKQPGIQAVPQYFVFPTGNAFHGSCLLKEVMAVAGPSHKARLKALLDSVPQARKTPRQSSTGTPNNGSLDMKTIQRKLFEELRGEDPYNGELVIRNIDLPFILSSEQEEIDSWSL